MLKNLIRLTHFEVFLLTSVFIFVLFGLYFSHAHKEFFETVYTLEDGLVEWITVCLLAFGALLCWWRAINLGSMRSRLFVLCTVLLGFVFVFGLGEEISWGQRIFGWASPEFFYRYNSQGETNLHNLVFGDFKVNKTIFGLILGLFVVLYVAVLPFLYRGSPRLRVIVNQLALPLPRIIHLCFYLLLFIIVSQMPSGKKGEILEFGGCALFLLIVLNPVNQHVFDKNDRFDPDKFDPARF